VLTTGRRGLFLQGDQHQAVEMGSELARILTEARDRDAELRAYYRRYVRYLDEESTLAY
jgi:hypothetical protein